jgi:hypothetical protein
MMEDPLMIGWIAGLRSRRQQLPASQQMISAQEGEGGLSDIVDDAGIVEIQNRERLRARALDPCPDRRLECRRRVHAQ